MNQPLVSVVVPAFEPGAYLAEAIESLLAQSHRPEPSDWSGAPPEAVVASVMAQTRPGSIIVLHDGNPRAGAQVAETTDRLIALLRRRGYRFATVAELLARV